MKICAECDKCDHTRLFLPDGYVWCKDSDCMVPEDYGCDTEGNVTEFIRRSRDDY